MGLADAIVGAAKTLIGLGIGVILLFAAASAWFGFTMQGDTITGIVLGVILLVLAGGFIMWGEQNRRSTLMR